MKSFPVRVEENLDYLEKLELGKNILLVCAFILIFQIVYLFVLHDTLF